VVTYQILTGGCRDNVADPKLSPDPQFAKHPKLVDQQSTHFPETHVNEEIEVILQTSSNLRNESRSNNGRVAPTTSVFASTNNEQLPQTEFTVCPSGRGYFLSRALSRSADI
jgi:hypothetical protein